MVTWEFVNKFFREKCIITIAFFIEIIFELLRVTGLMIGTLAFLKLADMVGMGNNVYIEMLHQFSIIGFSILYVIVLGYGILDFYRIFNKSGKHDSIQLDLDEVSDGDGNT
jgi:nucleoside recognition membrane protein YjiH